MNKNIFSENSYYEPEFEIDGTADELCAQARLNYIDNPDALHRIVEILKAEGKENQAELVGYIEERERLGETTDGFSVPQMKIDLFECDKVYVDDVKIADNATLTVLYEPSNETLAVSISVEITDGEDVVEYLAASSISKESFMKMSQTEFENEINSIAYYNMRETGRYQNKDNTEKPKENKRKNIERD